MQVQKPSRRLFLVFRLPLLVLVLLAVLLCLGYGGWRLYRHRLHADPASGIRRGMQERIAGLDSYHARFKTIPVGQENNPTYTVEIWSVLPHRYRVEMSTSEEGRQSALQVIIGDRERVYLYDPDSAGFIPVSDPEEAEITGTFLEDYWRSIGEAASIDYLGEERGARHRYYRIEIVPSDPHRYRVSERVWLEQDSLLPVRIESFDAAGRLTQVTVFELLQLNPELEAALFQIGAGLSSAPGS